MARYGWATTPDAAMALTTACTWAVDSSRMGDRPLIWAYAAREKAARRRAMRRAKSGCKGRAQPNWMMSGSANRLRKNGSTAASESGPPMLSATTAKHGLIRGYSTRTARTRASTFSIGVSGYMPCPRLKM